ncbi:glutathione peroxidase [Paenibacillus sambharensis]|uniref:Glutathione peroxidase n=1 Tax=Paenibacillus sambharensis TaxID=1803190 RepID=A0A2W1L6G7_9BACL|nr:glutathione peroxidase [Paenibacillus sambharensis]PZD94553.1 glutathione peroxidase [Paenibacillus sambharensis]
MSFYDIEVTRINGEQQSMADYKGKVLLIVNTASKCGYTPQYEGLQELYEAYHEQGLEILGFPCNQFMNQEPGSEEEIAEYCKVNHGVTFPMFAKVDVNGSDQHPLYKHLTAEAPGILGSKAVKWNFTKFLVNREGKAVKRFAPGDAPESLKDDIKALL